MERTGPAIASCNAIFREGHQGKAGCLIFIGFISAETSWKYTLTLTYQMAWTAISKCSRIQLSLLKISSIRSVIKATEQQVNQHHEKVQGVLFTSAL